MNRLIKAFDFWDLLLTTACVAAFGYAALFIPNFLSSFNLSQLAAGVSEKALLILPMTLLIITREIDLSVASALALTSVVFGMLLQAHVPWGIAVLLTLLSGAVLGAFNGLLVTFVGLQSLVVTLGTMALFRGIGYMLLGSGSVNILPNAIVNFGIDNVPGTAIPLTIVPFVVLAPFFTIALQNTAVGKRMYALGGNPDVARYSGIRTRRMVMVLFIISGVVAAIAGMVYTARLSNARADNAFGMELDVITIVLLGGVSVFGGKGRITGVMLALLLIAIIRNILGLTQVGGDAQSMVVGLLLIGSLLVGNTWNADRGPIVWFRARREAKG